MMSRFSWTNAFVTVLLLESLGTLSLSLAMITATSKAGGFDHSQRILSMLSTRTGRGKLFSSLSSSSIPGPASDTASDKTTTTTTTTTTTKTSAESRKNSGIVQRTFRFVPFGKSIKSVLGPDMVEKKSTISCDGKVDGTTLELTHWNGNITPDKYYADTSTGMALLFGAEEENDPTVQHRYIDAVVVNNHYDTDGALAVFSCLHPSLAREYKEMLISAAEAGDFNEWNSDEGVQLECALTEILKINNNDEEKAYVHAMQLLPELLQEIRQQDKSIKGKYAPLWESRFDQIKKDYNCFLENKKNCHQNQKYSVEHGPGNIVIVHSPSYVSPSAVSHALNDAGYGWCRLNTSDEDIASEVTTADASSSSSTRTTTPTRILHAISKGNTPISSSAPLTETKISYDYYYEQPGHGWVYKLIQRKPVPPADSNKIVTGLGPGWKSGGPGGSFISICQGKDIPLTPQQVAALLLKIDGGASLPL